MNKLNLFRKTLAILLLACAASFQGAWAQKTITIGSSSKADHPFSAFDSLLTEVSSGNLTGQLTFAFESGTYVFTKALNINTAKFTAKDHLTITSVAQNQDSVTFRYSTSTVIPGFILLNNTNHVTFSHLYIHNNSTSGGHTVCVNGPIEDVTFYHCYIKRTSGANFATSGTMQTIGATTLNNTTAQDNNNGNNGPATTIKWLRYIGNTIDNGCRNIITIATTNRIQGLVFNENTILDNTAAGIVIYRADSVTCNRNHVMVKDKTSSYWSPGIQLSAITGDSVCGNMVSFLNQTNTYYGGSAISVSGVVNKKTGTGKTGRILIANNVILGYNSSAYTSSNKGSCNLMSLSKVQADVYFNSVYNARTSYAPTSGYNNKTVFMLGIGDTCDIHMVGNMLVAFDNKNQHVMNISAATAAAGKIVSEYNNFYIKDGGKNFAYNNDTAITSLNSLLAIINDKGSISTAPVFSDATKGLKLDNPAPFTIVPNPGMDNDFQGMTRDKITTIGAYGVAGLDAALTDFGITEFVGNTSGNTNLYLTIMNAGMTTLTSATIFWDDGAAIQKFPWSGKLAMGEKDSVKVGTFKATTGKNCHIKAWVADPNNGKDGFAANDTIETTRYVCKEVLAGDYTIGSGKGMDFATLDDAMFTLKNCGVKAPVRLLLTAGTYGSDTIEGLVPGASSTNTITLMPYKNDLVVFDGGSTGSSIVVKGIEHWVFQGLTIGNTKDGLGGVELQGGNKDVTFRNCNIYSNQTTKLKVANNTTTPSCVRLISANNATVYPVDVRFIGNRIVGGTVNFLLVYAGGTQAQMPNASIIIDSNTMDEAYYAALYNSTFSVVKSFCYNTVRSRSNADTMFTAIHGNTSGLWGNIIGNRIHITTKIANSSGSSTAAYGMVFLNGANTTATSPAYICNNEIFIKDSSTVTKTKYGMYIGTAANWEVHYNTIYIYANSGTLYGMYLSNSNNSFKINATRNIVCCDNAGTRYPLYMTTANAVAARGLRAYNSFYSATNVAYIGAAKTTVAALQTATSQDTNTISVMPVFQNIAQSLKPANDTSYQCPNDPALIQTDIDGNKRGSVTVMGAYHTLSNNLPTNDALLSGFYNLNKIYAGNSPVFIIIYNNGTTEIKQANLSCTINGVSQTGLYYQPKQPLAPQKYDTVEIGKYNFPMGACTLTAWVDLTGDNDHSNDTISTKLKVIAKEDVALLDFANTYLDGGQSSKVYVTMKNNGLEPLESVEIQWTFNNTQQTACQWKGKLGVGDSTIVNIGSATPTANRFIKIMAWSNNPNGLLDGDNSNDTISTTIYSCKGPMSGTYTVASNGGARSNFSNVSEALQAVQTCGVSGAVTFSIGMSHTVKQLVIIDSIPGSNSSNTISFIPDYGVTVTVNNGSDGPSLILENTMYWSFSNFVFGDSVKGLTGLQMKGTNKHISFDNCTFHASETATQSSSNAIEFVNSEKSGKYPVNINFTSCKINGGFANFYFVNMASDPKRMDAASVNIKQCKLTNGFQYGIYIQGYGAIKTLSQNTITNRLKCKDYTAVHSESYAVWDKIERNAIHISNSGAAYGFYMIKGNQDANYTSKAAYMINNEIRIIGEGITQCGIYQYEPNGNWEIHNNSIYAQANAKGSNANGMELLNSNSKCKINASRNLVYASATTSYPLFIEKAAYGDASYGVREWNNLYSTKNVAYIESAMTTIAQLQATTKQDANSMSAAASYKNANTNLELMDYYPFACPMNNNVTNDFNGKKRTKLTPMGCYSIDIFETTNLKIAEVISPKEVNGAVCYGEKMPVSIIMQNSGIKALSYDTASLKVSVDVTGAITFHADTTFLKGGIGAKAYDTLRLGEFKTLADGIYQVKITLSCKADDTTSDNEASISYKMYRIGLPYDVDFTTEPKELVTRTVSGSAQWSVNSSTGAAPAYGKGTLLMNGMGNKGSVAEAVFNGIHLDGYTQPKLTFWYAHSAGKDQGDSTIVKVSTDGGATYTVLGRLSAVANTAGWKQYDYDLSKYATSPCLSIVFEGKAGGNNQQIDRIRLSALQDAAITLLPIDLGKRASCDKSPLEVQAVVTNQTMQPITLTNDTILMQISGAITGTTELVYSNTLAGRASDTITVGLFVPNVSDRYYLTVFMQSQDDVAANDTARDSFYIYRDIQLAGCSGLDTATAHTAGELIPLTATITNRGTLLIDRFFVRVEVNGECVRTDTVNRVIYAGDSTLYNISFPVPSATMENPYYTVDAIAYIQCDADHSNDTIHMIGKVNVSDIQVLDIITTSPAEGTTLLKPAVRIVNAGNAAAENVVLHVLLIDSSYQAIDTLSETVGSLAVLDTQEIQFTNSYAVPNYTGKYMLKAYVEKLESDPVQTNDTLLKSFECLEKVGIRNAEKLDWNMGQNIPNPASDVTAIPFNMPQEGRVRFSVMTANGQLIYKQEIQAEAGDNRLELNTGEWASGLYYYSMEYRGQRITRKMNIVR